MSKNLLRTDWSVKTGYANEAQSSCDNEIDEVTLEIDVCVLFVFCQFDFGNELFGDAISVVKTKKED